jgi:hypothetical protein
MKIRIFLGVALSAALLSSQAFAWTATAFDKKNGGSHTQLNADTPDEAMKEAMESCQKNATDAECVPNMDHPVRATAVVVVTGVLQDGSAQISEAANTDPNKAEIQALQGCRKQATGCQIRVADWDNGATWAAVATGSPDGIRVSYDYSTQADAENDAIQGCEKNTSQKGSCKIAQNLTTSTHTWYVIATHGPSAGIGVDETKQAAISRALDECNKSNTNSSASCKVTNVFENKGPTPAPASLKKVQARIVQNDTPRLTGQAEPPSTWRKHLALGSDTHCGMVVEMRPPLAKVQTMIGEMWFRSEQLWPPGTKDCHFLNGVYQDAE